MKFKRLFLIPAFIIFLTTITHSATLVVDNTPFPFFCGGFIPCINCEGFSWGSTYQTIQEAVNNADDGDTIKICKGDYNEQVQVSGINNLTITSGSDVSSPDDVNWYSNGNTLTILLKTKNLKIQNLKITTNSQNSNAIYINSAKEKITFENLIINSKKGNAIYGSWNVEGNLRGVFKNLIITTEGNGINIKKGETQQFQNIKITMEGNNNWNYGIRLDTGVKDKDHLFDNISFSIKKGYAFYLSSGKKVNFTDISITATDYSDSSKAIYLDWDVSSSSKLTFQHINVNLNKGTAIKISKSKNLTLNDIEISGCSDYAIYSDWDVKGDITLTDININSHAKGVYLANGKKVNISNLTINSDSNNINDYGLYMDWGNKFNNIVINNSNITTYGQALRINKSKKLSISLSKFTSFNTTIYIDTDVKKLSLKNSCILNLSSNGNNFAIYIHNWKKNIKVNNNCIYAQNGAKLARDVNGANHNWDHNYWDGVEDINNDGIINSSDTDKIVGNINDFNPQWSCPNNCNITPQTFEPVADFHFDECSWSGVNGEIIDSSGNGYNGTAKNGILNQNVLSNPPLCKKGVFNGTNQYIEVPNLSNILKGTASLSFWIKTTQTGNNIDWQAPGVIGVEEYGGEDDIFWGWIDAHGHIGISKGDNFHNSKSHTPINDGQWHHIVLTRNANNGHVKIYIDGNLDKSGTTDSGIVGTPFSSIGRIENTNTSIPPEYFQGELDEIKVFDFILNDSQVQQIYNNEKNGKNFDGTVRECPACPKVNHYEIIHDSNALTCEPENITIKACENDNCSTLYSNNVTITLSPSGWIGGDTKSFSGGEATFKLKHTTAETVTLGILSSDPSADFCCRNPDIDSDCVNDEEHCNIVFNDAGFVFDVPNQLSCKNSDNIIIRAVEKNDETNECKPSFTNTTKNLKFWFNYQTPSDNINGVKLKLKGNQNSNFNELPTSEPSSSNVEIHFNSNGIGTFQVKYNDAGRLNLHAKYEDSSGLIMTGDDVFGGSGNGFVVKPYRFLIDIPDNPEATSANGDIFKKAGEDFEMKIIAVCSDNSTVTKNYFSGSDGVEINHTLILPSSGNSGNLRVTGVVINNGEKTINNQSFSEVGIISINVIDSDYLGAGSISGSVDYVGRFTPHHFIIENISNGVLNEKCSENFNYSGQKTDYSNIPQFTIVAKNKDNQTTENYKDNFYKLSLSSFNIQIPQYDDNQLGADGINKVKILIENSPDSLISNNDGTAKYSFENDNITYIREDNSKIAPFSPQFSFKINSVEDSDGISCINLPQTVKVTGKTIKYGRLKIFDNYGPETENLKIPVKTEYWNGDRWIKNIDDSCTQLNSSYFELYNFTGNLNPGETSITDVKSISAGEGSLTLTAPGENNDGSVSIKLNNIYDYLIDEKTPGKATFGIFRGRDRIIFWQEVAPDE